MNTTELENLIHTKGGKNKIRVCSNCGCEDVLRHAWVNANTKIFVKPTTEILNEETQWCPDCKRHVGFIALDAFEARMHQDFLKNPVINPETWTKLPYKMKLKIWRDKLQQDESETTVQINTDKNTVQTLKEKYLKKIKDLLESLNLDYLNATEVNEGYSPILHEDPYDGNNSHTLDAISIYEDGTLTFEASSCCDNVEYDEASISLEKLIGISEWLDENIENLKENIEEQ